MTHSQVYCTDKLRKNIFFDETRCGGARGRHRDRPFKAPLRHRKAEPLLLRGRVPRRHGMLRALHRLRRRDPPPLHGLIATNPTKHNKDHKSAALPRFSFFLFRPLPTLCDRAPRMASPPHFPARPARGHPLIQAVISAARSRTFLIRHARAKLFAVSIKLLAELLRQQLKAFGRKPFFLDRLPRHFAVLLLSRFGCVGHGILLSRKFVKGREQVELRH